MKRFDRDTIAHLEKLARIELRSDERERLTEQLARIVEYVESLQEIETEGIEPTPGIAHGTYPGLRADEALPGLGHETVLSQAPDAKRGFFRVPKIIDG